MRRALLLLSVAALVTVGLAAVAAARTETRFTVVSVQTSQKKVGQNTIVSRDTLWSPVTGNRVGRDVVKITFRKNRTGKLHAIGFFRGEGTLKVQGTLARGNNNSRFLVIGGTGDFNGAAGKVKVHNLSSRKSLLHFAFVQ